MKKLLGVGLVMLLLAGSAMAQMGGGAGGGGAPGGAAISGKNLTYTTTLGYTGVNFPVNVSTFTVSRAAVAGLDRMTVSGDFSLNTGGNWRNEYAINVKVTYGLAQGAPTVTYSGTAISTTSWMSEYMAPSKDGVVASKMEITLYQTYNTNSQPAIGTMPVAVIMANIEYEQ